MSSQTCLIIGASHGGVNCAFALRKEGWEGNIILIDADPYLPYHRPPLSKTFLTEDSGIEKYALKSAESYEKENIQLRLGEKVTSVESASKKVKLENGEELIYSKLVLATGARALVPSIDGIDSIDNCFVLRSAEDVLSIKNSLKAENSEIVIIGAGYIGLELAASLRKLGHEVTVLELADRILARVASPELSAHFHQLHTNHGVKIVTQKKAVSFENIDKKSVVKCADGTTYPADTIILGVGIHVNTELAEAAGLEINNGISVNEACQTSDADIYSIGDCTFHHNPTYNRDLRLESVQNAVDQAKVAATSICGKEASYNSVPWFWSDQYDVKLQMVGLSEGYDEIVVREEIDSSKKSIWYFKEDRLLAVDAINNPKAYVIGGKIIKASNSVNKTALADSNVDLKPANVISTV